MRKEKNISLRTTKKGTKILQVKINVPNDKPIYKNVIVADYPTEKLAMDAACKIRDSLNVDKELASQIRKDSKKHIPTVKECFEAKFKGSGLTVTTKKRQTVIFNQSASKFSDVPITEVTASMVKENISEFAQTHTDDYTDRAVSVWSQIFEYAIDEGFNVKNPSKKCRQIKGKKVAVHRKLTISEVDFKKFLSALIKYNHNAPIGKKIAEWLLLIKFTGLQPAEAMALTIDDIGDGFIFINKMIGSTMSARRQIVPPKNEHRERFVPIHKDLYPLLETLKIDAENNPNRMLFVADDGLPWDVNYITNYISLVSKASGIEFHAYMLRHNVATRLTDKGVDIKTLGELLGHIASNTTVGYIVSSEKKKISAINKLN